MNLGMITLTEQVKQIEEEKEEKEMGIFVSSCRTIQMIERLQARAIGWLSIGSKSDQSLRIESMKGDDLIAMVFLNNQIRLEK